MEVLSRVVIFLAIFLLSPLLSRASPSLTVVINEIAWMGGKVSPNDEWIELYNNTDSPISLDGWVLKSIDGNPEIKLKGLIPPKNFYLLERTDDNAVPDILADQIYTGALSNEGEDLKLYDNFSNLIDSVGFSSGWLFGVNSTKQTMERIDSSNWQTSQNPGGTPKAKNSVLAESEIVDVKPLQPAQPQQPAQQPIIYPAGIVINEILPSPEGPDETEEWIEIFNQNNFEVDLSGWQAIDTSGKTTTYTFPFGTKILPQGFLVPSRPTTKITLNNDEDGLLFIQPDGNILDTVTYEKAPRGQSYNLTESGWVWSTTLTPGSENIIPSSTLEIKTKKSSKETAEESIPSKESRESQTQKQLAAIGEQIPKSSKSLYIFLIALALAFFSGVIILILKRKLKI